MRKILIFLISSLSFSNYIIEKIVFNGKENALPIQLNSTLVVGEELKISKIDTMVENFKFAKNNNFQVNIEPSDEDGKINLILTNEKKIPYSLSLGVDNHGLNDEDGKYRYTLDFTSSGLFLNENLNIKYTFVREINPTRSPKKEIEIGEIVKKEQKDLIKARKNNSLNILFSFPIKNTKTYINYSFKEYKKSIIANNDIYDMSGNSNIVDIKLDTLAERSKDHKVSIITGYGYTKKMSYLEDVLLANEDEHRIDLGARFTYKNLELENIYRYIITKDKNIQTLDTKVSLSKRYNNEFDLSVNLDSHLEKDLNSFSANLNTEYLGVYSKIGINTNGKNKMKTNLSLGIRKTIWKIYVDTSLNYSDEFKYLFNIKANIF